MELFNVKGMMCGHCSARVEKALLQNPAVTSAKANFETGEVQVESSLPRAELKELIEATGYDVLD